MGRCGILRRLSESGGELEDDYKYIGCLDNKNMSLKDFQIVCKLGSCGGI